MYPPISRQKAYKIDKSMPVSEKVGSSGLWLPSHVKLKEDEVEYI